MIHMLITTLHKNSGKNVVPDFLNGTQLPWCGNELGRQMTMTTDGLPPNPPHHTNPRLLAARHPLTHSEDNPPSLAWQQVSP
mmetsp:Transcript_14347/g.24912  ORF Transcript_14347/g.24912 Transcript_14347/m.24912 type:complete len:82 (-) Transcript_14347:360-605(-)